jgi:FkbH-like protein
MTHDRTPPSDSSARAALRERLRASAKTDDAGDERGDVGAAFAFAHLDPLAAAAWFRESAAWLPALAAPAVRDRLLTAIVEEGLARHGQEAVAPLTEILAREPGAVPPAALDRLAAAAPATLARREPLAGLIARTLDRVPAHPGLLRTAAHLAIEAGDLDRAHALLTRLGQADPSQANVHAVYRRRRALVAPAGRPVKAALLASYSVDALVPYVDLELRALGLLPEIYVAPFNSWTREALEPESGVRRFAPEVIFLAVAIDDLVPALAGGAKAEDLEEAGAEAVERVLFAARELASGTGALLIVHSFHSAYRSPLGPLETRGAGTRARWIADLNRVLATELAEIPRAYLLDMEELLVRRPGGAAEQPKMRYLAAMRLGEAVLGEVARAYARYVAPLKGLTRKCVVLDLDGTLWGGTVGEDGLHGIRLGGTSPGVEYQDFQRYLLGLTERGILLAVNSKNNPEDALAVIRTHEGMILREEHFSAVRINWLPKAENMASIAEELGLGVDHFVFLDDNPMERELMRQAFPRVLVPDLPHDPALVRPMIELLPELQTLAVTEEDKERVAQYRSIGERKRARTESVSLVDYLHSLGIEVEVSIADDAVLPRIGQLFQRTNQFNLTARRYDPGELAACARDPQCRLYALRARDRFGDHGLVATALVRQAPGAWTIDSLLMSCRVIGYGVETALLAALSADARAAAVPILIGEFVATAKNAPARDFYSRHGFVPDPAPSDGTERWRWELAQGAVAHPAWIGKAP